ncbi:hypothetical protein ACFV2I_35440 [Streptomyces microflavus]|uniref:hypothetical protein n=1 Tax=Streptomyces microflavus TaxID=1919 RepID=UPI00367A729E
MGRPEKPVDRTVPASGQLADFLRDRKATIDLTYEQMADLANGVPSAATFKRAASGASVPSWDTVEAFIKFTLTEEEKADDSSGTALERAQKLWIRARRATRAPYYLHKAPDPALISSPADLCRALRHQHMWAGCPTPGEMQRMTGSWELPSSTTRRIIQGLTLPADPRQAIAFLNACYVTDPVDLEPWLTAALRAFNQSGLLPGREVRKWVEAHQDLTSQIRFTRKEMRIPQAA